jgi:ATP-dependent RNA helicase DDX51/DBP6
VADETDRLLRQSYQEWLPQVLARLAGSGSSSSGQAGGGQAGRRVVKLVVSATLTRDPAKLERLQLHCPRYISMSAVDHRCARCWDACAAGRAAAGPLRLGSLHAVRAGNRPATERLAPRLPQHHSRRSVRRRYKLPPSLQEFKLVASAASKPLLLLALLHELAGQPVLVFASSLEATHKLALLLAATAPDASQVRAGGCTVSWDGTGGARRGVLCGAGPGSPAQAAANNAGRH